MRAIANGCVYAVHTYHPTSGFGHHILIKHYIPSENLYLFSHYAHLEQVFVTEGQTVLKGQSIGIMGQTGNASGIHLHLEQRKNFSPTPDPEQWPPNSNDYDYLSSWIDNRYTHPTDFIHYSNISNAVILFQHALYEGGSARIQDLDVIVNSVSLMIRHPLSLYPVVGGPRYTEMKWIRPK
jgi:hypothetical protein